MDTQTITPLMTEHDTTPNVKHDMCVERVYRNGARFGRRCQNPAIVLRIESMKKYETVEVDDRDEYGPVKRTEQITHEIPVERWYCRTHDPIREAARNTRRRAQERQEWEARQQRDANARVAENAAMRESVELVNLLGCGAPSPSAGQPYVLLSADSVRALLSRAERTCQHGTLLQERCMRCTGEDR